jgi:hypothetical protein
MAGAGVAAVAAVLAGAAVGPVLVGDAPGEADELPHAATMSASEAATRATRARVGVISAPPGLRR